MYYTSGWHHARLFPIDGSHSSGGFLDLFGVALGLQVMHPVLLIPNAAIFPSQTNRLLAVDACRSLFRQGYPVDSEMSIEIHFGLFDVECRAAWG